MVVSVATPRRSPGAQTPAALRLVARAEADLDAEPVSPELILVSPPEVARRARQRLAPVVATPPPAARITTPAVALSPSFVVGPAAPPAETTGTALPLVSAPNDVRTSPVAIAPLAFDPAAAGAVTAEAPAAVAAAPAAIPAAPPQGVPRATIAVGLIAVVSLATSLADTISRHRDGGGSSAAPAPVAPAPHRSVGSALVAPSAKPKPKPTRARSSQGAATTALPGGLLATPRPAATPSPAAAAGRPAAPKATPAHASAPRPTAKPQTPKAQTAISPARVFAWPPVPGASTYVVRFERDGKRIFETRSTKGSIQLKPTFTFVPGTYRWQVRPVLGAGASARLGAAIVDSSFLVSARTASRPAAPPR